MKKKLLVTVHLLIGCLYPSQKTKTIRPTMNFRPVGVNNSCCDQQVGYNLLYQILDATIVNKPEPTYCNYMPIFASMTITSSGAYCLNNSVQGTITIASNDVMLDLNSYSIGSTDNPSIIINQNLSNIRVKNGVIQESSQQGFVINENCTLISLDHLFFKQITAEALSINKGCRTITLQNLTYDQCATSKDYAISINGTLSNPVSDIVLKNIEIIASTGGIYCNNTSNVLIKDIVIKDCTNDDINGCTGIALQSDQQQVANIIVDHCSINQISAQNGPARGISVSRVNNVYFNYCVVGQVFGNYCSGYNIFQSSQINLSNCCANQIIDSNTFFTGDGAKGFYSQNCSDVLIKNFSCSTINSAYGYAYGIQALTSPRTIIDDTTCTNISSLDGPTYQGYNFGPDYAQAPRSFGLEINQSPHSLITNSSCVGVTTNGIGAFGFHIDNCPFSALYYCYVDTLSASQASWAFRVFEGSDSVLLDHCTSLNLTVTSAPFLANLLEGAVGFEIDSVQNIHLKDCVSTINNALASGSRAAGLTISSPDYTHNIMVDSFYTSNSVSITSTLGNGIQLSAYSAGCTFKNCISKDNSGSGLFTNAPNSVVYDSQFLNCAIGIANYSTSSTIYNNTMTNCGIGLYNDVAGSIIYSCSSTQNTVNYSNNVPNVVMLGGVPVAGNNLSDTM